MSYREKFLNLIRYLKNHFVLEGIGTELIDRVLQNLHPQVRSHLIFTEKPKIFPDVFVFASAVAEAVVIEKQHRSALNISAQEKGEACST
jgi:hypothetical protein